MKIFIAYNKTCAFQYSYDLLYNKLELFIVDEPEEADFIIFPCTCSGTFSAIKNTINFVDDILKRKKSTAKTCLTGCVTRLIENNDKKNNSEFKEYFSTAESYLRENIDFIVPDGNIDELIRLIFSDASCFSSEPLVGFSQVEKYSDSTIANIFVAKWCLNRCSFCETNYQNSKLQSVDMAYVKKMIDEVTDIHVLSQIYLIASNVTQYGLDLYGKYMLSDIIRYLDAKQNVSTIGLVGFTLKDAIRQNLVQSLDSEGKPLVICSGLESGSDRILSLMKKGYSVDEVQRFITDMRNKRLIVLNTNIMAGFPTETLDDIKKTIDLLIKTGVIGVNLCTYSDSPFIPSHQLPQLNPLEILNHAEIYEKELKMRNIAVNKRF